MSFKGSSSSVRNENNTSKLDEQVPTVKNNIEITPSWRLRKIERVVVYD